MQRIAFENGLAETAFLVRTGPARFYLRWFTPVLEVNLCGHATLAAAHTIFTQLGETGERLTFDSRSGPLTVTRRSDRYELDFPARPAAPTLQVASEILTSLRSPPREVRVAVSHRYYLAIYDEAEQVRSIRPDFSLLGSLGDVRVIVTAPGEDCDFVSRFFAPGAGVPEDPVTGSAHCTLVPYWAERLGKNQLHARQVSARGGEIWCELRGERVGMAGHAVLYLRGEIEI
jgi:PhzF family phenazine biosynthesis protein